MKITVLKKSRTHGLRKFNFTEIQAISILFTVLLLPLLTAWIGYQMALSPEKQPLSTVAIASMQQQIDEQQQQLIDTKAQAQLQLDALTIKIGGLQAELRRINVLGQRVASLAKINKNEFDFSQSPGMGGPAEPIDGAVNYTPGNLFQGLDDFSAQLNDRAYQLEVLRKP